MAINFAAETNSLVSIQVDPSFFTYKSYDKRLKVKMYTLNPALLSKDRCHLFFDTFPEALTAEKVIAKALLNFPFHTSTEMGGELSLELITVNGFCMLWCSFPKERKEICARVAKIFNMKIMPQKTEVLTLLSPGDPGLGVKIEFPKADHILRFDKEPGFDWSRLAEIYAGIEERASDHLRLGLA